MTRQKTNDSIQQRKAPKAYLPEAPSSRPNKNKGDPGKTKKDKGLQPSPHKATQEKMPIGARISRRAADRLRAGHVWVYASDLEAIEAGEGEAPSLLPVADNRGLLLGTALYSSASQIALRMVAREAIGEGQWLDLIEQRLKKAVERRLSWLKSQPTESDSCRLCFSEADELPGLVVDKYGDLAIVQLLAKGLDSAAVRERVVAALRNTVKPAAIWERPDPRIRELEALAAPSQEPLFAADPKNPQTATQFELNGLKFHFDVSAGQKTGAFLDQKENYEAARGWAERLGATGPGSRCVYLPGRICATPGAGLREGDRYRCLACVARGGRAQPGGQSRAPWR